MSIAPELVLSSFLLACIVAIYQNQQFFDRIQNLMRAPARIFFVALVVRLLPNFILPIGAPPDMLGFHEMGKSWLEGINMYASRLGNEAPYLPLLIYWAAFAEFISSKFGLGFVFVLRLLPIISDALISLTLATNKSEKNRIAHGTRYALHPVSILVSSWHGQMDSVTNLFSVLALTRLINLPLIASLSLGLGIGAKSWGVVFVPILAFKDTNLKRASSVFIGLLCALLSIILIYILSIESDWVSILRRVLGYNNSTGIYGYSYWFRFLSDWVWSYPALIKFAEIIGRPITLAGFALTWWFAGRFALPMRAAFLMMLSYLVFTGAFAIQYLTWITPFAVVSGSPHWHKRYVWAALAYMIPTYTLLIMTNGIYTLLPHEFATHFIMLASVPIWLVACRWFVVELSDEAKFNASKTPAVLRKILTLASFQPMPLLLGLISVCAISVLITLVVYRVVYPYEIEWIEGAFVDQARWILRGHLWYFTPPSIENIPFDKTPLNHYLVALLMLVFGEHIWVARILSIASTFIAMWVIARYIWLHTRQRIFSLTGAGLFASAFGYAGAWYDIAKNDSLMIALTLISILITHPKLHMRADRKFFISGLSMGLAILAKQTVLPVGLAMAFIYTLRAVWHKNRAGLGYVLGCFGPISAFTLIWHVATQGWSTFYLIDMPSYHERTLPSLSFWQELSWRWFPTIGMLMYVLYQARTCITDFKEFFLEKWTDTNFHTATLGVFVLVSTASSLLIYTQRWTYLNAWMPLVMGMSVGLPLMAHSILKTSASAVSRSFIHSLLIVQFLLLGYPASDQIPTPNQYAAGEYLVSLIRALPGRVMLFSHGYYASLANKPHHFTGFSYADMAGYGSREATSSENFARRNQVQAVMSETLQNTPFDWVIVDDDSNLPAFLLPSYIPAAYISPTLAPLTGAFSRPSIIMARNPVLGDGTIPLTEPIYDGMQSKSKLFSHGWGNAEEWGRWGTDDRSSLNLWLPPATLYTLSVTAFPYCPKPFDGQKVNIYWDKEFISQMVFNTCEAQTFAGQIDTIKMHKNEAPHELQFVYENLYPPQNEGDRLALRVGFTKLIITRSNP